jgi:hypothetical protein
MADSSPENQRKRRSGVVGYMELVMTFGLASVIAGSFGMGSDYLKGRQRWGEQRCSIAQQVVLDDGPNEALNGTQRARLNALALRRVEQCLGETP